MINSMYKVYVGVDVHIGKARDATKGRGYMCANKQ